MEALRLDYVNDYEGCKVLFVVNICDIKDYIFSKRIRMFLDKGILYPLEKITM